MPPVEVAPQTWMEMMTSPDWAQWVQQVHFSESVLDPHAGPAGSGSRPRNFPCAHCGKAFASHKALLQHCRIAHKQRVQVRLFIDDSGVCPACSMNLVERYRVIRHVTDRRRPRCRDHILASLDPLDTSLVQTWEDRDRARLRQARQEGSTHILASGSASTAAGKRIGGVQR